MKEQDKSADESSFVCNGRSVCYKTKSYYHM